MTTTNDIDAIRAELNRMYSADTAKLRAQVGERDAELEKARAELAEVRNQAHRDHTEHQQVLRDKNALANENARLRQQVCLIIACAECGETYEYDGGTVHFNNLDEAQSMVEDDDWRRVGDQFVCGGCIYEPHPFTPAVNDETTCARCDIEADEHEPAKAEAVAR